MEIVGRLAQFANIVSGIVVVYDLVDKHGWWPVSFPRDPGFVLLAVCVIAAALLNTIALQRDRHAKTRLGAASPPSQPTPTPKLSSLELQVSNNARGTFRSLLWYQMLALREIYRNPGVPVADLVNSLTALNFCDPDNKMIAPLLKTNLIGKTNAGTLHPSPDAIVRHTVETLLDENPL
jgi:hypothetical protein